MLTTRKWNNEKKIIKYTFKTRQCGRAASDQKPQQHRGGYSSGTHFKVLACM